VTSADIVVVSGSYGAGLARILISSDFFGLPHDAPSATEALTRTLSIVRDPPLVAA
jgi:hypothetical protein